MKLTISRKIALGFSFAVITVLLISFFAYISAHMLNGRMNVLGHAQQSQNNLMVARLHTLQWEHELEETLFVEENPDGVNLELNPRLCTFGTWFYGEGRAHDEEHQPALSPLLLRMGEHHEALHELSSTIDARLRNGDVDGARELFRTEGQARANSLTAEIEGAQQLLSTDYAGTDDLISATDINEQVTINLGIAGLLATLVIALLGYALRRNIVNLLSAAVSDLSSAASQISATAEEHERVLVQQEASVSEATTTMDELGASARMSSEHSASADERVQGLASTAGEGTDLVEGMAISMTALKGKISSVSEQIARLSERTSAIEKIVTDVTGIADQTNMLALNAAVEAAHAGEHGKGFAVVAREIRTLADQSRGSSEQIGALIREIQQLTQGTVMVAEDGVATLDKTSGAVEEGSKSFLYLAASVDVVADNVKQLSLSAKEQASAIEQVVEAMNSINGGAQQSSAGLRQTRIGVERLQSLAENILAQV